MAGLLRMRPSHGPFFVWTGTPDENFWFNVHFFFWAYYNFKFASLPNQKNHDVLDMPYGHINKQTNKKLVPIVIAKKEE
jgi:hypothetical protein